MSYKYKVIRSTRKTVSIIISVENEITIRAPWSMHFNELQSYIDSKEDWINKVVTANAMKFARNIDIVNYKKIFVNGVGVPLIFGDKNEICDDCVYLKHIGDVADTYTAYFEPSLQEKVKKLADITKTYPASVSVKAYKGRWGCCDPRNNLIFNYMIFMLPENLQNYVVVHELCHTICHNHSQAFWKLVEEFLPNYRQLKKLLSFYDFLTALY